MEERLQKILAGSGLCSRRKAEEYIRQGRVAVDGRKVTGMGLKFNPRRHRITVDGKPLVPGGPKIYLLLNKPKGYVTTMRDPQGRPIVTSLLKGVKQRVFPVGRLDLDTEGALLLTNDGELAQKVLHPRYEIKKTYQAVIKGKITREKIAALETGIELDGRRTWPAELHVLDRGAGTTRLKIIIHEGRKRQVRRMLAAVGHPVIHLKRLAYGNLRLGSLAPGKFRYLNKKELERLFSPPKPAGKRPAK